MGFWDLGFEKKGLGGMASEGTGIGVGQDLAPAPGLGPQDQGWDRDPDRYSLLLILVSSML